MKTSLANEIFLTNYYGVMYLSHMYRVAELAYRLARAAGICEDTVKCIYTAGIYHDIGKREIDKSILGKQGPLTPDERALVNTHPVIGAKIGKVMKLSRQSILYILEHHENFDGSGYPKGICGNFISLGGRILKICDVFDALSSDRDYRKAFTMEKAFRIMEMEKHTFDPELYLKFKEVMGYEG